MKKFYALLAAIVIFVSAMPASAQDYSQDYEGLPKAESGWQWVVVGEYNHPPKTAIEQVNVYIADNNDNVELFYTHLKDSYNSTEVKIKTIKKTERFLSFTYDLQIITGLLGGYSKIQQRKFCALYGRVYVLLKTKK